MKKILSFFVGLIVFSVLPIIGWGIKDINGFVQNPFRLAYIVMMAVFSIIVVIVVPNEGKGYGEGIKPMKRQKLAILFLQIAPLLMHILSPYFDHHRIDTFHESNSIRGTGLFLSCIGFLLMNWSVVVLGKQFSVDVTIQDNHKLISVGPYKYIRHPRYAGIIIFLIGIPVLFLSWIPLLIDILLIMILLWRIRDEEKLMHQEFKKDWEEYKKRTYSLIPYIY
jgi:protein-S-isoprenylcysteine O-methyltransferase Ste14